MTLCSLVDVCDFRLRLWPPLIWLIVPWLIISWLLGPYFIWIYVFHFWSTFIVFFSINFAHVYSIYSHFYPLLFPVFLHHPLLFLQVPVQFICLVALFCDPLISIWPCMWPHIWNCPLLPNDLSAWYATNDNGVDFVFLCRAFNFRTSSLVLQIYIFLWIHMLSQLLCLNL